MQKCSKKDIRKKVKKKNGKKEKRRPKGIKSKQTNKIHNNQKSRGPKAAVVTGPEISVSGPG